MELGRIQIACMGIFFSGGKINLNWLKEILNTVHTPVVDPFPIEDPSLKIQIEEPYLFSKKWVLGALY